MKNLPFLAFIHASIAALLGTAFFPSFPVFTFAPFLVYLFLFTSLSTSLWIAALTGLLLDFLSSSYFGLNSLTFVLITALLYNQKRFFSEKAISISLFTALISLAYSLLHLPLYFIFESSFPVSFKYVLSDLIFLPFLDATYAFVWFSIPFAFYKLLVNKINAFKRRKRC